MRCRTRIPLFHNEEEQSSLLSIQPNLFRQVYLRWYCDNRGVFVCKKEQEGPPISH